MKIMFLIMLFFGAGEVWANSWTVVYKKNEFGEKTRKISHIHSTFDGGIVFIDHAVVTITTIGEKPKKLPTTTLVGVKTPKGVFRMKAKGVERAQFFGEIKAFAALVTTFLGEGFIYTVELRGDERRKFIDLIKRYVTLKVSVRVTSKPTYNAMAINCRGFTKIWKKTGWR